MESDNVKGELDLVGGRVRVEYLYWKCFVKKGGKV